MCPTNAMSIHDSSVVKDNEKSNLVLGRLLVDISLGVVLCLVHLVSDSVLASTQTSSEGSITILGNVLVGLLGSGSTSTLNGLADVVGGVLNSLHFD